MKRGLTERGVAFSIVGSGPPQLWLSGYMAPPSAIERYVAEFAARYTCIVVDARGSGSDPPAGCRLTTAGMAYDALDVLNHLGHDSAHVHGISLGGMVAQELALRAPHRVRTLVLGATTAGGTAATPATFTTMWLSLIEAGRLAPGLQPSDWRGALQQAVAAGTHDATSRLRRTQAPTLVMHGRDDRLLPPSNGKALAALIPRAHLILMPGVGHFYPIHAAAASAKMALDWMAAQGEVPPGRRPGAADLTRDLADLPARWTRAPFMPLRHAYRMLRPET